MRRCFSVGMVVVTFVGIGSALGQDRNPAGLPMGQEARVALVIGNSNYKLAPLENPANDAADLANALEKQGFKVLVRENVGEKGLKDGKVELKRRTDAKPTLVPTAEAVEAALGILRDMKG